MALIPYPSDGWNTFLTIEEADVMIPSMTDDGLWLALTDPEKEIQLINSCNYLKAIAEVNDYCDFKTAQAVVIQTNLVSDGALLGFEAGGGEYESVKVGSIAVTYSGQSKSTDISNVPPIVSGILRDCLVTSQTAVAQGFNIEF